MSAMPPHFVAHVTVKIGDVLLRVIAARDTGLVGDEKRQSPAIVGGFYASYSVGKKSESRDLAHIAMIRVDHAVPVEEDGRPFAIV